MEPRRGRPKKHQLVVSPAQRSELERIARQSRSSRSASFRARIVLECAGGASNAAVAGRLRTTVSRSACGATVSLSTALQDWGMSRVRERRGRSATRRLSGWYD